MDVGSVRVGVAVSDPGGVLAVPLVTLKRDPARNADLDQLAALAAEHEAVEVVVGLPRSLNGQLGKAAQLTTAYADALRTKLANRPGADPVAVVMADERLTTVVAARTLTTRRVTGKKQRAVIDQAAAVLILQDWLDGARGRADDTAAAGDPAGTGDDQ